MNINNIGNKALLSPAFKQYFSAKHILFLLCIYLLGYGTIIVSDIYYADDLVRRLNGGRSFDEVARYVNQYVIGILNFSNSMIDSSPFFQIVAIFVLIGITLSSMLIFKIKNGYWHLFCSSIIGLFPFLVGNLLYKVDAPFMLLAVLFGLLPFLFRKQRVLFFVLSYLAAIFIMSSYQLVFTCYYIVLLLLLFDKWLIKESIDFKKYFLGAVCFFLGVLTYKLIFSNLGVVGHVKTALPEITDFIPTLISNYKTFIKQTIYLLGNVNLVIVLLIIFMFISSVLTCSKQHKGMTFLLCLVLVNIFVLLGVGSNLFVADFPVLRVRYYAAFSFAIGLMAMYAIKINHLVQKPIYVLIVGYFLNLTNGLANAVKEKTRYRNDVVVNFVKDFKDLVVDKPYLLYDASHEESKTLPKVFAMDAEPFQGKRHHYPLVKALINDMDIGFDKWFVELYLLPSNHNPIPYNEKDAFKLIMHKMDYDILFDGINSYHVHFRY